MCIIHFFFWNSYCPEKSSHALLKVTIGLLSWSFHIVDSQFLCGFPLGLCSTIVYKTPRADFLQSTDIYLRGNRKVQQASQVSLSTQISKLHLYILSSCCFHCQYWCLEPLGRVARQEIHIYVRTVAHRKYQEDAVKMLLFKLPLHVCFGYNGCL